MGETTDRNDPKLKQIRSDGQQEAHIVLPDEGQPRVRPLRTNYVHTRGCGFETSMKNLPNVCRTYQTDPTFYSHTFCVGCGDYKPVAEFDWTDGEVVGS
jgi:hypothetical protein